MISVIGFLVMLGPLVVIHELGHFFFARLFNIKAEAFSVGFGPVLFKKQIGETEWRLSAIPMGGYVKLLGEEPDRELSEEEKKRSLNAQAPWKRFFVYFGGPLFNFIFAAILFMGILFVGEPEPVAQFGRVEAGSYAEKVGLQSGDKVVSVNGQTIDTYEDWMKFLIDHPSQAVDLKLIREGKEESLSFQTQSEVGMNLYGEVTDIGKIDGLSFARATQIGVSDPNSLAGAQGVKTGHWLVKANDQKFENYETFLKWYQERSNGEEIKLEIAKDLQSPATVFISFKKDINLSFSERTGIYSSELFIAKVIEDSPAKKAGLQEGDRFISVGEKLAVSFTQMRDEIQNLGREGKPAILHFERKGEKIQKELLPEKKEVRDALMNKETQFMIGFAPNLVYARPEMIIHRVLNPITLLYKSFHRMIDLSGKTFVSIGKIFTGDVSLKTLGGPVLIGKIAGESMIRGWIVFLSTMAMISISLGVLNILPVPVLDGGHILLLGIEVIRGKPLSMKQLMVVQQAGFALILLLMVVVLKNDIMRLPFFDP